MPKEGPNEGAIVGDGVQLFVDPTLQLFSCPQRGAGHTRALGMAPHQLIGIQVWHIEPGKKCSVSLPAVLATYCLTTAFLCAGNPSTTRRTGFLRRCINCLSNSTNNSPVKPPS